MKYTDYSVRDFIEDEYFQNWVFHNDEAINGFWEGWVHEHPHKRLDVEQARTLLRSILFYQHVLPKGDVSAIWKRIHDNTKEQIKIEAAKSKPLAVYASIAATLIVAVLCGGYYYLNMLGWNTYQTSFGETQNIILPDGSSVVLNANSKLSMERKWDDFDAREISLDGEAFFKVVHKQSNQAFRVLTPDGVTVEVLGTSFNVYNRTHETKVVLNSGKIRLNLPKEASSETIMMRPGEMIEYKSQKYNKKEVNPSHYIAWTSNKIILDHTTLEDMIHLLRDTYGLDVEVSNASLLKQTVSGSMPLGDPQVLLEQMARAFQLRVERENSRIKVSELK